MALTLNPPVFLIVFLTVHLLTSAPVVYGRTVINYKLIDMTRSEIVNYFRSVFQSKFSSNDKANEEAYLVEEFAEDLYHSIDNLIPRHVFTKLLMKTKNITDKTDARGTSLLPSYQNELNLKCDETTIFNHSVQEILLQWDGDRSIVSNALEDWHKRNADTQTNKMCNRFRGLTCQFKRLLYPDKDGGMFAEPTDKPTCQCAGDDTHVGFFYRNKIVPGESPSYGQYPDGCYIRPWKSCRHLSLDNAFVSQYREWHNNMENYKRQLAQLVFPVPRTHRCKKGTYCLDMIPGMNKPVCWCTPDSTDPECIRTSKEALNPNDIVPRGSELALIRYKFLGLMIKPQDKNTKCDPKFNQIIEKIANASGKNPTVTKAVNLMKQLLVVSQKTPVRICDFRESMYCDSKYGICKGKLMCDEGKIHLGKGVCAVDNGYFCTSNEDCVVNAKCKKIEGMTDFVCICETGYGSRCRLENPPFFSKRFLPIISGFQNEEFLKLQVHISGILESWEDSMNLNLGESCDPRTDLPSMEIVKYFGNLIEYDQEKGEGMLLKAKEIIQNGANLCRYHWFMRCHPNAKKCVPLQGTKFIGDHKPKLDSGEPTLIHILVNPKAECVQRDVPLIFKELVAISCPYGYFCKMENSVGVCKPDCDSLHAPKDECPPKIKSRYANILDEFDSELQELKPIASKESPKKANLQNKDPYLSLFGRQDGGVDDDSDASSNKKSFTINKTASSSGEDWTKDFNFKEALENAEKEDAAAEKALVENAFAENAFAGNAFAENAFGEDDHDEHPQHSDHEHEEHAEHVPEPEIKVNKQGPPKAPQDQNQKPSSNVPLDQTAIMNERKPSNVPQDINKQPSSNVPLDQTAIMNEQKPSNVPQNMNQQPSSNVPLDQTAIMNEQKQSNVPQDETAIVNEQPSTNVPQDMNEQPSTNVPQDMNEQPSTNVPQDMNQQPFTNVPQDMNQQPFTNVPQDMNEQPSSNVPQDQNEQPSSTNPQSETTEMDNEDNQHEHSTDDETSVPPASKAKYGDSCRFDDSQLPRYPSETCDGDLFLICGAESICKCPPGLIFQDKRKQCVIPVGERCASKDLNLPQFMRYTDLRCEYGECLKDNQKEICRPEQDTMLLLVNFRKGSNN